jgi:hypothetical protein
VAQTVRKSTNIDKAMSHPQSLGEASSFGLVCLGLSLCHFNLCSIFSWLFPGTLPSPILSLTRALVTEFGTHPMSLDLRPTQIIQDGLIRFLGKSLICLLQALVQPTPSLTSTLLLAYLGTNHYLNQSSCKNVSHKS